MIAESVLEVQQEMKDSNDSSKSLSTFNCVDLFSGAGGFTLAAQKADFLVRAAVEFDRHACTTYRKNFIENVQKSKAPVLFEEDILGEDLVERVAALFENTPCDVLLGGPPCQGYSTHRIKGKGINDPRNALILRYFEFVEALKPAFFLMENVPGMLWPRHADYLEAFYKRGRKAGYKVFEPVIIDAQNYGIPQRRKRVFILGMRRGTEMTKNWPPAATHGSDRECAAKDVLKPRVPARVVFDKPLEDNDPNNIHMNHTPELIEVFKSTPFDGGSRKDSSRVLECHKNYRGHLDVYGRIDTKKPGPTMTTACVNPSKGRFLDPWEHHGIAVRHAARFQTFPEDFVFEGGLTAAARQIGNAVPVDLAVILLKELGRALHTQSNH